MTLTKIASTGVEDSLRWVLGANGMSDYTFTGPGLTGTVNDPTIYLTRGHTYIFQNNNTAGAHPFYIKTSIANGGANDAYNTGVTNNGGAGGTEIIFTVPHDSPDILYYQCGSHINMAGQFNIAGSVANGSITTAKLADDAVNNDKLADSVVAAIAANTAKTTNATHTGDVTGSTNLTIATNAVTTTKIAADAITNPLIADNAVENANIANQAVTLAKIANGTSSQDGKFLRANNGAAPTFETINTTPADGSITEAKLANGAVTQTKIADGSIINVKVNNNAAIAGTKISPDFGSQNVITDGNVKTGPQIITNEDGGGHMFFKNNSSGANYSSHFQTYSGGEGDNVQTHIHYYHGGYAELLHQGSSAIRTRSGGGVDFNNGSTRIGIFDPEGLKFGTDTSSSNALDDYEEGTYTPKVGRSTSNYVKNSGYVTQQGTYTKIGRLVHATMQIYIATGGFGGSGYYWIPVSGLPFAPQADTSGCLSEACSMVLSRLYIFAGDRAGGTNAMTFKMQSAGNLLLKSIKDNSWHTSGEGNTIVINGTITYYTAT